MKFIKGKKSSLLQFFCIISNSAIKWCTGNRDKGYNRWRFRTTTLYTQYCYDLCTRVWSCETFSVVVVTINIWIDVNWRIRDGKTDVFHLERMFDQRQHGHQSRCRVKPVSSGYPRDSPPCPLNSSFLLVLVQHFQETFSSLVKQLPSWTSLFCIHLQSFNDIVKVTLIVRKHWAPNLKKPRLRHNFALAICLPIKTTK